MAVKCLPGSKKSGAFRIQVKCNYYNDNRPNFIIIVGLKVV